MAAQVATKYSVEERVDIIEAYIRMDKNSRRAARLYASSHPDRQVPSHGTFVNVYQKFRTTGSVCCTRSRKQEVVSEDFEIDVLAYFAMCPEASIRNAAGQCGRSEQSVWRVLHKHNLHPYHVCLHQDLTEADFQRRLEFCNWIIIKLGDDREFLKKIIWTDEAKFYRDGNVNLHNAHYWSAQNPHWLRPHHHQVRWSTNVWCGILGSSLIGPYFFDDNLTGTSYADDILGGVIDEFTINLPLRDLRGTWFQHDGAPPHFSTRSRSWLDRNFPDRWIGRSGPMFWPPRSPDLSPLDFFLWGYIKSQVYTTEPRGVNDLKQRITDACSRLTPEVITRAVASTEQRLMLCVASDGKHFEQFM